MKLNNFIDKQLKDPEFKKYYDEYMKEYQIIIVVNVNQKKGMKKHEKNRVKNQKNFKINKK